MVTHKQKAYLALWCVFLTLLIYGQSLELPYFFDDLDHILFAQDHNYSQIWETAGGFPYYRPLGVSLLRLVGQIAPDPVVLFHHATNLLLHALNGWLVGWLLMSMVENQPLRHASLAATFFILFPFSYQAVPWVDAVYHLLTTTLILAAVSSLGLFRQTRKRRWLFVSLLATWLAPFAHEGGFWALPLILLYFCLTEWPLLRECRQELMGWGVAYGVAALSNFFIWQTNSPGSNQLVLNRGETLVQNGSYFLQGLVYPFGPIGGKLVRLGFPDLPVIWLLALLTVGLIGYGAYRIWLKAWLFFLGWYVAACLLPVLFLSFQYVIDGPRLLMVASVGIAAVWSLLLNHYWQKSRIVWQKGVWFAAAIFILWSNVSFLSKEMSIHRLLGDGFKAMMTAAAIAHEAERQVVFVNPIGWMNDRTQVFPVGHEGVMFRPNYIPATRILETNTDIEPANWYFVRYDSVISDLPYVIGVFGEAPNWPLLTSAATDVYVMRYSLEQVKAERVGEFQPAAADATGEPFAQFRPSAGDVIQLVLHHASVETTASGQLVIRLIWETEMKALGPTTTIFVHGVDQAGVLLAQADGQPLAGIYPFTEWSLNQPVVDIRYLPADQVTQLQIGVYDAVTGQRWWLDSPAAPERVSQNAILVDVP